MKIGASGKAAVAFFCLVILAPAVAQTMYKCGRQYQDRPCEGGQQGRAVGSATSAQGSASAGSDAECSQRGSDALKVVWSREGGATADKLLAEIDAKAASPLRKELERKLVQDVYQKRGSAPQIRAAIEAECLADKERLAQAAALAAAAAKLQAGTLPVAPATAPATAPAATTEVKPVQEANIAGEATSKKTQCAGLASSLATVRASQRSGGSVAMMEKLKDAERRLEAQVREAGC